MLHCHFHSLKADCQGFFDETTLPKGEIRVAVEFADMLTPNPPTNPTPISQLDPKELPKPTEDLDQVRRDMKKWGYGLIANAMSPKEVHIMKEALRQQAAGEVENGVANRDGGPHAPNQRIWTLINKGQEFVDFLEHPLIDEFIPDLLGDNFLVVCPISQADGVAEADSYIFSTATLPTWLEKETCQ